MKQMLQNMQIKNKLIIIIMSMVIFSLLLVGSVLIVTERYILKQSMADKLMTVSHIIADGSTAALSFDDQQVATEVLSALEHESSVMLGCIYDESKLLFAAYAGKLEPHCPSTPGNEGYEFLGDSFELFQPIELDGEIIGTVFLRASLHRLNSHLMQFMGLVIFMTILTGIITLFLANRQQAIISKPILALAQFAKKISLNADYSSRLPQGFNDEMGTLNRAFNDMLEQIYQRQLARDKAEKALSEREQDLVVTLNSIGDAVIVTDVDGKVTRMNPVAERLTGWNFKQAQSQSLKTIFPIVNASTREEINNPVEKVIATGETVFLSNHTTLIAKDGTELQIADSAAPIRNENDDILGMILVFNDVTEAYQLRESAAKSKRDLQAIMDNTPAVIFVKDIDGGFTFINRKIEKSFSIQRDIIIGKTLDDIFSQDISQEMHSSDQAVLSSGSAMQLEEFYPHEDGNHVYSVIKFPLFDEEQHIYAICTIATDISDRKQQEEQLQRSQKMDALGKLTGGIAHDYNNMLGIIMGYAELLNEQLSHEPKLSKYVSDIEHAARRGSKLTKKLLAFTRHKRSDAHQQNINTLLLEQKLMLEKTLTARITLDLDLDDGLWPVWIDGGDLEDAIINISINASHAIEGNGQLTFRTHNEQITEMDAHLLHLNAGDYVLLTITDTGTGMDEATKEKIFDPFFSTKGEKGTGLGLSQVYGFVKRSGGDIKIYSELGHGSRFSLYFPRSYQEEAENKIMTDIDLTNLCGHETLLLVDDEQALLELAQDILVAQGYQVLIASDGEQALKILEQQEVDLMLSDVIMPKMDGYQLAEQVHKLYPQIKIQMASGFADGRHIHVSDDSLSMNMLYKPYTSNTLLVHVRKLLDEDNKLSDNNTLNQTPLDPIKISSTILAEKEEYESHAQAMNMETKTDNQDAKCRILVMDDEEDIRELFSLILTKLGYDVIEANDSDEAIASYKQSLEKGKPIDALIVDLNIPGSMGGKEMAVIIRELNPKVKIVVSSGDSGCSEMTHYQEHGFDGALEKIFDKAKIQQLFTQLLA
ncbi:response regulator [sulfur-oxidizing endosymbiont of Gigantopelta aegis]|uniref:response regulator n=1 Tax=sulfur-oxidizing endosymbiont of Gigantopelta aegis TaxID=2794934 RepID=UPI0018DC2292|nr:response regulator [sulfur-oxidizing endosymbiont of Gigantopelta aegis]